jgi:hypothetical protein
MTWREFHQEAGSLLRKLLLAISSTLARCLVATAGVACLLTAAAFTLSVISRCKDDIVDHFRGAVWPALAAAAFRL